MTMSFGVDDTATCQVGVRQGETGVFLDWACRRGQLDSFRRNHEPIGWASWPKQRCRRRRVSRVGEKPLRASEWSVVEILRNERNLDPWEASLLAPSPPLLGPLLARPSRVPTVPTRGNWGDTGVPLVLLSWSCPVPRQQSAAVQLGAADLDPFGKDVVPCGKS